MASALSKPTYTLRQDECGSLPARFYDMKKLAAGRTGPPADGIIYVI